MNHYRTTYKVIDLTHDAGELSPIQPGQTDINSTDRTMRWVLMSTDVCVNGDYIIFTWGWNAC